MAGIKMYVMDGSAPCLAVMMLADELKLNITYQSVKYGETTKAEFVNINPQHCVPTIDDNGFVLWESQTIMIYLIEKLARDSDLYPSDLQKRAIVNRILNFYLASFYPAWLNYFTPAWTGEEKKPENEKAIREQLKLLDKFLDDNKYVAGSNLTIADLSVISGLSYAEMAGDGILGEYDNVTAWMKRIFERDNIRKLYNETVEAGKKSMGHNG